MNYWDILDIKPTDDNSVIKKAYAKKLKIFHPEDDPEGFQRLREAYDFALKYSKSIKAFNSIHVDNNIDNANQVLFNDNFESNDYDAYELFIPHNTINSNIFINQTSDRSEIFNEFIEKAEKIYSDFDSRIEIKNWESLLNSDIMWDLTERAYLSQILLDFLYTHNHLPQNIWIYLNNNFCWSEQENTLYSNLPDYQIRFIVRKITYPDELAYKHLSILPQKDLEQFLDLRERAYDYLLENQFIYAYSTIKSAKKIYENDPDLLRMEAVYHLCFSEQEKSLICINQALSINSDNIACLFLRADIYFNQNQIELSINDYVKIHTLFPVDKKVFLPLGNCYFKLNDFEKAKVYYEKALNINPSDNNIKASLLCVNKAIKNNTQILLLKNPLNKEVRQRLRSLKIEIRKLNKETLKPKSYHAAIRLYLKIAIIVIVCMSILLGLNSIFFDKSKVNTASNPISTPISQIVKEKDNRLYLNDTDISNTASNTKITADIANINSLNTLWVETTGADNIKTSKFYNIQNTEDEINVFNKNLMAIGSINGKYILIIGSQRKFAYKNLSLFKINGTIMDVPSSEVIDTAKYLIKQKKIPNVDLNDFITDKYIKTDIPTNNSDYLKSDLPQYSSSGSQSFPISGFAVFLFIMAGAAFRNRNKA